MKAKPYNWSSLVKSDCRKKDDHCDDKCDDHCNDKCKLKCKGCACAFFSKLPEGTLVTIIGDSGTMYDMVVFKKFDPKTCCVTLKDEDVSPPEASIIKIDCQKIESVSFATKP